MTYSYSIKIRSEILIVCHHVQQVSFIAAHCHLLLATLLHTTIRRKSAEEASTFDLENILVVQTVHHSAPKIGERLCINIE